LQGLGADLCTEKQRHSGFSDLERSLLARVVRRRRALIQYLCKGTITRKWCIIDSPRKRSCVHLVRGRCVLTQYIHAEEADHQPFVTFENRSFVHVLIRFADFQTFFSAAGKDVSRTRCVADLYAGPGLSSLTASGRKISVSRAQPTCHVCT
jgi:hypothetical protein